MRYLTFAVCDAKFYDLFVVLDPAKFNAGAPSITGMKNVQAPQSPLFDSFEARFIATGSLRAELLAKVAPDWSPSYVGLNEGTVIYGRSWALPPASLAFRAEVELDSEGRIERLAAHHILRRAKAKS